MAPSPRLAGLLLTGATSLAMLAQPAIATTASSSTTRVKTQHVKASARPSLPPGMVIDPPAGSTFSTVGGDQLGRAGVIATPGPGLPRPPDVPVGAYVIADADTGQVLAARNPHWKLRPASTLKMLTAVTLLPKLGDENVRYVGQPADPDIAEGGSAVGIAPGVTYTIGDLWRGVFLRSGNDAVGVLARLAGGVDQTVRAMRDTAQQLNANDTTVVDADGYDADGQYSSAYDLALIARAGLRMPAFRGYCSTLRSQFPGKDGKSFEIDNENHLLGVYPGMIGVKNGYTSGAHWTFVGAATRGGHTLIVSVMDAASRQIYPYTSDLLNWGFDAEGHATPVGTLVQPGSPASLKAAGQNVRDAADTHSRTGVETANSGGFGWPGWSAIGLAAVLLAGGLLLTLRVRARRPVGAGRHSAPG
jgi:D-alanyl-D-alanine carboxypeptidase (penicillin-binding protein 5/6)